MTAAPIALFVYNRPVHTRQTLAALQRNPLAAVSDLHIFADGAKANADTERVDAVRRYIRTIDGFRSVRILERRENLGLARSIIHGVTEVCEKYGRVIVLEDDLVSSPWFLHYMNDALDMYADDDRVASIHAYSFPTRRRLPETFFLRGADCWGWATWTRAWRNFEPDGQKLLDMLIEQNLDHAFDLDGAYGFTRMLRDQIAGRNDSWAVRWHASCFLRNALTLHPGRSLVVNIGADASGTHCADSSEYETQLATSRVELKRIPSEESAEARAAFAAFLRGRSGGWLRRRIGPFMKRIGSRR